MRWLGQVCLLFFLFAGPLWAAEAESRPVTNIFILRSAEQLQGPHVVTYRVFEWSEERGKWIFPDFGYFDTGYGREQIWFAGAGAHLLRTPRINWEQDFYVSQEAGPESKNRRAFWIWPVVNVRFPAKLSAQVAAYPTLPLNRAQRWGYDVDRAKLERRLGAHWSAGVGYAGGICETRTWESKPFLTATHRTKLGNFEVWLQKIPGGSQAQVRYVLVRGE
ncbi:hypothetical protein DYQ86_25335 [Acidobacteria bacterium AB60]|nr:hypothetical protein DYQ86_25335 [Acidobacteria bacterium AB60]